MKSRERTTYIQLLPASIILLAVVILSLYLGVTDQQEEFDARQAQYCELRQIHIATGGEYGWPSMPGYGECE